jgi:chemotaxis signal transduction protein
MIQQTKNLQNHDDILLESGTNELEVLVFRVGAQPYGVNVTKVEK